MRGSRFPLARRKRPWWKSEQKARSLKRLCGLIWLPGRLRFHTRELGMIAHALKHLDFLLAAQGQRPGGVGAVPPIEPLLPEEKGPPPRERALREHHSGL